jgi:hypothetical protein
MIVSITAILAVYLFVPTIRPYVHDEGGVIENLSATLFFYSAVIGFLICTRLKDQKIRKAYIAIPILGTICFLDEISFGHIFFGFTVPKLDGVEIESLHELLHPVYRMLRDHSNPLVCVPFFGAMFLLFVTLCFKYRHFFYKIWNPLKTYAAYNFVLISFALGLVALVLDLDIRERFLFLEELLEMNGALAMLFAAALIPEDHSQGIRFNRLVTTPAFEITFLISVVIAAYCGVVYGV